MSNKGKNFIKGTVILSAAGLISKLMGFVYRVVLTRIIGAEGIALYQLVYPIYTTLLVISRSGIPVSLAKLIADRFAKNKIKSAYNIFRTGRYLSIFVGFAFSLLMFALARPLVNFLQWDERSLYAVLAISPAIFIVSIMATYRGFFQGLHNMFPTALSQVLEQLIRMITMISLVYFLMPFGLEYAAAGATFGAVTGSIAGLLLLIFIYYKKQNKIWSGIKIDNVEYLDFINNTKEIILLGLPITIGALVQPLMNLVDAAIVPQRLLSAGFSSNQVLDLFGQLSGVAMVLVNFPTIITVSLAASLVPSISEAFALKRADLIARRTRKALKLTVLIGFPSSVGLFILARPLTSVIFNVPAGAVPLKIVSWGVIFITIQQTSSAIIHGLGKPKIPARNLLIGAVVNAFINYTLTGLPEYGIKGAALGTVIGFAVAALLNVISLKKYTSFKINYLTLLFKPILSVLFMGWWTNFIFNYLLNFINLVSINIFITVFSSVIIYLLILLILKEINYDDIILIPGIGKNIANLLKRIGLGDEKNE